MANVFEVFLIFLRLGLTSFGGPVAHLSYLHDEFVTKRRWLDENSYADLVALCQFLPGPASSQIGISIGLARAGVLGAVAAWIGFTLPSAVILVSAGLGAAQLSDLLGKDVMHGLKIVAVAVVAQAIWQLAPRLCPDLKRAAIAFSAAVMASYFTSAWGQVSAIAIGGILGWCFLRKDGYLPQVSFGTSLKRRTGIVSLVIFFSLLLLLPVCANITEMQAVKYFDSFFRAGSLVFGGGHAVLPLLQSEVVIPGWVSKEVFTIGYGLVQAIPGPLFTFSAYLGAVSQVEPNGWAGAMICLGAIFLPSFLLIFGVMPFWDKLRKLKNFRYALLGINASVVGLLVAAFYSPIWDTAILSLKDLGMALCAFMVLVRWRWPSWSVVLLVVGFAAVL